MNRCTRSPFIARALRTGAIMFALGLALTSVTPAFAGRVFIDPGHGGSYPGAVSGGVAEETMNLYISLTLRDVLAAKGHDVALSRTSDVNPNTRDIPTWHYDGDKRYYYADGMTGVYDYSGNGAIPYDDLQSRCDKANLWGADIFISIHCDGSASSSARGTATYRNWDNETDHVLSQRLAELVQDGMLDATTPHYTMQDDGIKNIGFYVIRWSNMPAILVECAFLTNTYERGLLTSPLFRLRLAQGISNGVDQFFAEDPFTPLFPRVGGETRYHTAALLAEEGWPNGADTVLLASGETWPDALAATPLSASLDAPLILTKKDALPGETATALQDLSPSKIIVLGGEGAIDTSTTAEAAVAAGLDPSADVSRIAGVNRYETAALIAEEIGAPATGEVLLVSGTSFPDALSASSYAGITREPILLTKRSALSTPVVDFLALNTATISTALVVGGDGVVSDGLVTALRNGDLGFEGITVARIAGTDRYQTNTKMLYEMWGDGDIRPYVATGRDYPDALCAGTVAAKAGEPIMLLGGRYLHGKTREFLVNEEARITDFEIVGGTGPIPYLMDWEIEKSLAR